jgi:hypothetical protein
MGFIRGNFLPITTVRVLLTSTPLVSLLTRRFPRVQTLPDREPPGERQITRVGPRRLVTLARACPEINWPPFRASANLTYTYRQRKQGS